METNPFTRLYLTYLRIKNSLDFPLRQHIHFQTAPVISSSRTEKDILGSFPKEDRNAIREIYQRLNKKYNFAYFTDYHTLDEIRENYYYLAMLDEAFQRSNVTLPESITVADIGPSSWFYVHALSAALTLYATPSARQVNLAGYEVDAYRLYSDFHTRKDHALGNMLGLKDVEYIDHGFEPQPGKYNVITMFFPFVFEKDHLEWGLPQKMFEPEALIQAGWHSLIPGGLLLIVNQGEKEHRAELKALDMLNIQPAAAFKVEPLLYTYPLDRYIITAKK